MASPKTTVRPQPVRHTVPIPFDPTAERPLPHNPEAELSILGVIILDNKALGIAVEKLRPDNFFLSQHRHIFEAMIQLGEKKEPIDTITLMEQLDRAGPGHLEAAGGVPYLSQLADGLPRVTNVEHYARIVKEKAILRNIAHAGDSMTAAALSGDLEIALARVESAALLTRSLQDVRPTRIVSGKELLQMDVEPREYIIDGLLPCRSMAEIFSWRGVGKTYFALTLADAAASAKKFLHWEVTKPRPVLFVDGELDAATLQQRLKGLGAGTDNLKLLCCDMQDDPFPNLATIRAQNMIEDALGDAQLLILDNLSALAPSSNETEGEDWIAIQTWLLDLRRRGIATIFLHHAGHSGWSRGTTRREDLLDLVIELRRPKDYVATEGLRLELHFTKTRGLLGLGAEPIEARLETDLDGKLIWATRNLEDLREKQILDLRASGSSIREIAEATGIPRTTVDRILKTSRRAT